MKKLYYLFTLTLALILFANVSFAQLNYLQANASVVTGGAYTDLGTNGTPITTGNFDDAVSAPEGIGFTFRFNGTNYTDFILSTNGWIKLGTIAPSSPNLFYTTANSTAGGVFNSTATMDSNFIVAFMHDLIGATNPEYRTFTTGAVGSRVCTIQFKNLTEKNTSVSLQLSNINFQIKLYETSNIIEIVFGTFTSTANPSAFRTAGCGLRGSSNAANQLLTVTKGSVTDYSLATFLSGNYTGNAFNYGNNVGGTRPLPTPGVLYRFIPTSNNDMAVTTLYTLGKLPIPMATPDTIRANIRNLGLNPMSNFKVYLKVTGANTFRDSITLGNLNPGIDSVVRFNAFVPANAGTDTVEVFVANDENNTNNSRTWTRSVNFSTYSYSNPAIPPAGGVGFTGGTGDFVAKFFTSVANFINQVSVNFNAGGQPFQIGIWDATGPNGTPGANLWTSTSQISNVGIYTLPVSPMVPINGAFYVGVRQTGTVNISFSYQNEAPIRRQTFYYASPTGSTNWIDFAPGSPFRFMIEPRVQLSNDVAVLSVDNPINTSIIQVNPFDTIAPRATITNFGSSNQTVPFNTTFQIWRAGTLIYTSTKSDTLSTGISRQLTFDRTFIPDSINNYNCVVFTSLSNDGLRDNDTIRTTFSVQNTNDVGANFIFNPSPSSTLEFNSGPITPSARIINYGTGNQASPFNVTFNIWSGATLVYTSTKSDTLSAGNSRIILFDNFNPLNLGQMRMEVFTSLFPDNNRLNDTVKGTFTVIKSNDLAVVSIENPLPLSTYELNSATLRPRATIKNEGSANQLTPFDITFVIRSGASVIYSNTKSDTISAGLSRQISFDSTFVPNVLGSFTMEAFTRLGSDQNRGNDTVTSAINIVKSNDVGPTVVNSPANASLVELSNKPIAPKATIRNYGIGNQLTPFNITYLIRSGATIVYTSTKSDTIAAGTSKMITFDSTFVPNNLGTYGVEVFTSLSNDQVRSNDTILSSFTIIKSNDVGVVSVDFPAPSGTIELNSGPHAPAASISNFGLANQLNPFNVTLIIKKGTNTVYTGFANTTLNAGATKQLQFASTFIPTSTGTYDVMVFTELANDQVISNDTIFSTFEVVKSNDVGVVSVDHPSLQSLEINSAVVAPKATVHNFGIADQTANFDVTLKIFSGAAEVYSSTQSLTLNAGTSEQVTFDSSFVPNKTGNYSIVAYTSLANDQSHTNDTAKTTFNIIKSKDAGVVSIDEPLHLATIKNNEPAIAPKATVKNFGDAAQTFNVTFNIKSGLTVVYSNTKQVTLNPAETKQIVFDQTYTPSIPGIMDIEVFTSLGDDQLTSNDTMRATFSVLDATSVKELKNAAQFNVYPNPFENQLTVVLNENSNGSLKVKLMDIKGSVVADQEIQVENNNTVSLMELNHLPAGFYILKIEMNGNNQSFKLIKN